MNDPGPLVRRLRKEKGWDTRQLAEKLGMSYSNLAKKERGEIRVTDEEREQLATIFGLTLEEFDRRWKPPPAGRTRGGPGIPVINRANAGLVIDYEEYGVDSGQGFEYLDWGDLTDRDAFAVIVVGDSMQPILHDGDYLVLVPRDPYEDHRPPVQNGAIVLIRFTQLAGGGGFLCRWHAERDGRVLLTKDNPKHKPRVCRREDIEQLAVAVERRTKRL